MWLSGVDRQLCLRKGGKLALEWDHREKGLPPLTSSSVVRVWVVSYEADLEHAGHSTDQVYTSKLDVLVSSLTLALRAKTKQEAWIVLD